MSYTQRLVEREAALGRPVRVGIVGAGQMGSGLVAQVHRARGMEVSAVADVAIDRAEAALAGAGRTDVERATSIEHAAEVIDSGHAAVLDDGLRLAELPLDIVVEVSGIPDVAAQVAMSCVLAGMDVALMTVEADVTVGLLLARTAASGSAVYTVCRGDEPVECLKLVEYAEDLGLEVVVAGKGKNNPMRPTDVPEDVAEEAERKGMNPKMLTSFTDGTKTQIEMAALANATGYAIETPGMHGAAVDLAGLSAAMRPAAAGGILTGEGPVVEYVTGDVAPGVFVVVRSDSDVVTEELHYLRLPGEGNHFQIYRPFHLASIEAPLSIGEAVLDRRPSFAATAWTADVVAVAKSDLAEGTALEGIGGHHVHGTAYDAAQAREQDLLPVALAATSTLVRDVPAGQALTYADVLLDESRPLVAMRRMQDAMLARGVIR
ncbi:oxidoreductase [Brachybacterium ginsengisoli]|uniref:Oxidoreductase n=1 Tax=Brachybacterium ginsengisoli TaxID=1331682 RepID=A0A291H0H0_9MICO|nr:oxidoreductase [Brachybacterium ginsengisoli]ATG55988.1 oxidoreductase [Brachybacterium ginsengisoli]